MTEHSAAPLLIVRVKGTATEPGRISLQDFLRLGKHVQTAVDRVARVLVGHADSRRPGRNPAEISRSCALDVVALDRGSFEIAFDLPRGTFENMHLGIEAIENLLEGLGQLDSNSVALPKGYDPGVLHSLRDLGNIFEHGVDAIEIESRTLRMRRLICFDRGIHQRIVERIRSPVNSQRVIEGHLLMADFRHAKERCRIHPPVGDPVVCIFDESLEETVYEYLRSTVRVTGATKEDPATGKISSIAITDIEPLVLEGGESDAVTGEQFWEQKTLDVLAEEQGVGPLRTLEDVLGKAGELWGSDEDFADFIEATHGRRSEEA